MVTRKLMRAVVVLRGFKARLPSKSLNYDIMKRGFEPRAEGNLIF